MAKIIKLSRRDLKRYAVRRDKLPGVSFYHLSFATRPIRKWHPQNPAGMDDASEADQDVDNNFPEPIAPRISVATSIEKCFRAIYYNIDMLFEYSQYPHVDMVVYEPILDGHELIVPPEVLTRQRWVWDAHFTQEHWIIDPVEMKPTKRYRFDNTHDRPPLKIRPFDDPNEPAESDVGPDVIRFRELDEPAVESRASNIDDASYPLFFPLTWDETQQDLVIYEASRDYTHKLIHTDLKSLCLFIEDEFSDTDSKWYYIMLDSSEVEVDDRVTSPVENTIAAKLPLMIDMRYRDVELLPDSRYVEYANESMALERAPGMVKPG